jgi:TolB-like protein
MRSRTARFADLARSIDSGRVVGTTLNQYTIIARLGAGGMGEVYRALDNKLGRQVAIKILPESIDTDLQRLARFEREARLLACLNHPHIAAIHGFEQHDQKHFLVLELIEGETLEARLQPGRLKVREAIEVCKQIAEAIEAAHAKKIIHRDLKPANVKFTTGSTVKVLDFGLGKILDDESDPDRITQTAVTTPGVLMGTPAYMSPEQAAGASVGEQSDIWSFGCIFYECLTGERLFGGKTISECLTAVLQKQPDWERLPNAVPACAVRLLRKCLERDPRRRLRHIGDAVLDLEQALLGLPGGFGQKRSGSGVAAKPLRPGVLVGIGLVAAVALFCFAWSDYGKKWVASASANSSPKPSTTLARTLAVLPLASLSRDKADDYLSDELTDELITVLHQVKGLRVQGRTSSFYFKGKQESLEKMGEQLRVNYLLAGSVTRAGDRVRVAAELVQADGFQLWSTNYDLGISDILVLRTDVASARGRCAQDSVGN